MLVWYYTGPWIALRELARQIYSQKVSYGTSKDLHESDPPAHFPGYIRIASEDDMKELRRVIKGESRESRYQLLMRLYLHQRGFGDCYVMRTRDTNEVCFVKWLVTPTQLSNMGWTDRFPGVPHNMILSENVYTFEKFRQKGVLTASYYYTKEQCLAQGFKYLGGYVAEDNFPELITLDKRGFKVYNRVLMKHLLFRVTVRLLESYEPPAGIRVSQVSGETTNKKTVVYSVQLIR